MKTDLSIVSIPLRRPRGISLIEVVIVILMISILSAVALPRWSAAVQFQRVRHAADRLVTDLSRAREAAYNTSTAKVITFTVGSSQYLISGVKGLDQSSRPYIISLNDDPYRCTIVSVWGQRGTQTLTFNGYGLPDRGGTIIVSAGSLQKSIVIDAGTGTAVVQ